MSTTPKAMLLTKQLRVACFAGARSVLKKKKKVPRINLTPKLTVLA